MFLDKNMWLFYVILAGLSWGTYVPIIFYGGSELGGKANARLMAILCVGGAYFVIGVLFPLAMFLTGQYPWPEMKLTGLAFSSLAGVAGAVGAICVIFATQSARSAALAVNPEEPDAYKVFIAPLIFGLAPVINVLVSIFWHPQKHNPFHFGFDMPGWKLWVEGRAFEEAISQNYASSLHFLSIDCLAATFCNPSTFTSSARSSIRRASLVLSMQNFWDLRISSDCATLLVECWTRSLVRSYRC